MFSVGIGKVLPYDYLLNEKQKTRVNNSYSDWFEVVLGVPQRSIFGPLLLRFHVTQKAFQLPLYFFSFSLSPVFLDRLITWVYLWFFRLLFKMGMTSINLFSLDTPKNSVTNNPIVIICNLVWSMTYHEI